MASKKGSEESSGRKKKIKSGGIAQKIQAFRNFLNDERTHKIFGICLLMTAFFMTIAFTSNLFTWKSDHAVAGAESAWELFTSPDITVENWLGKIGAIVSLKFQNQWFGICAYFIPFLLTLFGVRIIWNVSLFPIGKSLRYSFFTTIWLSTFLGFIFHANQNLLMLAGGYGYQMSQTLKGLLGVIGTGALLVFSMVGFLVAAFNIPLKRVQSSESEDELLTDEETETSKMIPVAGKMTDDPARIVELDLGEEEEETEEEDDESAIDLTMEEEVDEELEDEESEKEDIEDSESEEDKSEIPLEFIAPLEEEASAEVDEDGSLPHAVGEYDPKLDLSSYNYPTLDLLENYGDKKIEVNKEELEANKNRIVETLSHYNISIEKIKATIGPTVTLFEIVPQAGVRISKIKNLEDDIALSLSALGIRIIAPIPGKGTIGIEVPNQKAEIVPMKTVLGSDKFVNSESELPIGLGKTISNEVFVADLAKMPHLLMAGSTGQGKSVGLNAILVSLLYKKHPAQVKFVLVDPKKVELTLFKTIERHFLAKLPGEEEAIITDTKKVINTLNSLCIEMDQRYELLKDAQVRNIKEYNAKFIARKLNPNNGHKFLPYIVLVVDEFADLIMTAGKEIETPIARLAQLARAIGIHLIIATQRPSVNIITGTIKANFPARIAFRVTSKIDSRTILDTGGADQLIGRGDMLLSTGADLIRLQCAFVDTPEVENVTNFIGDQRGYSDAHLLPEYVDESGEGSRELDPSDRDPLFADAAAIIVQHQQGSASLLQRRLKLGYNRAGRIIDQLEAAKIIGPFEGSKAREVLVKDPQTLAEILNPVKNLEP
ncbi:MAG: DNA translocase FtsK [Bacteroidetes bacterium]|nr:MAG: DNA translocase FtsK [Bacteroidota bacterium]REJ99840.1 MAG: DNA translocase FtsK [Bacteroidota bacterium]REK34213.1 MAG: DNA translocase FtsK [Bacteroidota bacterium]REK50543.1 MAG: DNA translocase FtsK [Bacteroidota bacterium]